jgi:hypothetical protein
MPCSNRDPPPPRSDLWNSPVTLPGAWRALHSAAAPRPPATLPANLTTAAIVAASAAWSAESASRAKSKSCYGSDFRLQALGTLA